MNKAIIFNIVCWLVTIAIGAGMFTIKYRVSEQERELVRINNEILEARRNLHTLRAEWTHLNDPSKLKVLARRFTNLSTIRPQQIITLPEIAKFSDGR